MNDTPQRGFNLGHVDKERKKACSLRVCLRPVFSVVEKHHSENMVRFLQFVLISTLIFVSSKASIYSFYGDAIAPSVDDDDSDDNQKEQEAEVAIEEERANLNSEVQILPVSKPLGQVGGLALTPANKLVAFHRADRVWDEFSFDKNFKFNSTLGAIKNSTFYVIDPKTGAVESEHGSETYLMPHGLTADKKGNFWVTDVGRHQVMKLDSNFKPILELGEKGVPGSDEKHFCQPSDVAVASNGDFFVADGYCNSRIMKFDKDGKLLTSFGSPNSEYPAENGEFFVPHSLALIEDVNLICVADRENERVQCFSAGISEGHRPTVPTGVFITKAENIGRVYAIREKRHYLIGVTGSDLEGQIEPQLFSMDMDTGKANTFAKGIENAHALAVSEDGNVFIGQIGPNQIVKLALSTSA
uniref:peptidylamidoglycolate lyase n=1 Tax=Acrobeloides nanus TaxID=290746 RepID=A0A914C064_9BILA